MKKTLLGLVAVLVLGVPTAKAIDFCCEAGNEALCCESLGKKYCPSEKACRTKCVEELCPEGYVYNNQTLKCEREVECTEGQETCGNSCCDENSWCADVATRLCCKDGEPVYSKDGVPTCCSMSCLGNWKLDAKICDCTICELECTGNKVLNEETCECDCTIKSCDDEDYTVDVELCECVKAGDPCASNADCSEREYCNNGACKACHGSAPYFVEGYGCSECKTNTDCTGDKSCIDYACTLSNAVCEAWQYKSEELDTCVGCSENANCDGTNVVCYDGYQRNEADGFVYCCKPNQYFSGVYCVDCPANATCNGTAEVTCNGSYKPDGSVEKADFACLACEVGQYYLGTSCVNCLDNGSCDGTYATCKPGYVGHNLEATNGACCDKTSQYYDGNECKACPEHATCDGSNIKPMQGYVLDGNNVVACATDGSVCSGCPVTAKYWNGSACVTCTADSNCAETESCVNNQCKHKEAQCEVGEWWNESWGDCSSCPTNGKCNGQELACVEGYEPYYTDCDEWGCCNKATQYLYTDGCMGYCETCPEGMVCDGTENRECKDGYVKNEYYDWVSCCRSDQYWTDCEYECYDCPAGATCDGTNVVCGDTLPYKAGGSCEGYRCVKCTSDDHCPVGEICSNNSCVDCKTDGSATCATCKDSAKPYWNGTECVRCITDSNCNLNGTCSNNVCTNQTCCEPNYYWNDYYEECYSCTNSYDIGNGRGTCYRDEVTCNEGYQRNVSGNGSIYCCNKTTEMFRLCEDGYYGECYACPTNAVCNGSESYTCLDGSIKPETEYYWCSIALCCLTTQYYAEEQGSCYDCPANATCDGQNVTCNNGFNQQGEVYWGNVECLACEYNQYRLNGQCYDCPEGASCDGENVTCNSDRVTHNAGTNALVCCHKSNQYYNNGSCASCPTGATCDGTTLKPKAGYYIAEGNVPTACATDGTKCAGCSSQTPYWNGSACVGCVGGVGCPTGYTCTDDFKCMINDARCETVDQFYHEDYEGCRECGEYSYSVCDGTNFGCQDGYVPNHNGEAYRCCRTDQYFVKEESWYGYCENCPSNATCNGGETVTCNTGYVENKASDYYTYTYCCAQTEQYTNCEGCRACPEGATCNGKMGITCNTSELPYKVGDECSGYRCVECTEHGHCPEGSRCENYTCVPCNTTGSSMCDTCTDSNARYWNGESCVRCIKDGNCDLNGSCSEYACVNQTNCNPGQFYNENEDYCSGCPSYATCYRDVATCNSGYAQHVSESGYVYCCNEKTQYWNVNYCWSGESCYTCPENAICDGSDFICKNGYVKITPEDECMGNPVCCRMDQYFSSYYGECRDCPLNATCVNGEVTCDEGFTFEEYDGGYCYTESADKCKYGQYYRYNRCYSCYDDTVAIEGLTAEQCANCPNRSYDGKYCYKEPPECTSTQYWGVEGTRCWECSENTWRWAIKSECETCPERYLRTDGQCWLCSNSSTGTITLASCNRCPQRYWREDNQQCPMCPTNAVKDATGKGCVCPTGQTWNATSYTCDTAS